MCLLYFSCVFFFRVFFSSAAFFSFWSIAARSNHITCSFWNQLRIISKLWVFDPHCSYCFYSETYSFAYHSSNSVFNSQQLNRKLFQLLSKSSVLRSFKTRKKKKGYKEEKNYNPKADTWGKLQMEQLQSTHVPRTENSLLSEEFWSNHLRDNSSISPIVKYLNEAYVKPQRHSLFNIIVSLTSVCLLPPTCIHQRKF